MGKHKIQKNKWFNSNSRKRRGFTLIELMVATSIFTIIMLAAMGSVIVTSDLAKRSQALNFTMDNLSFAIESMSRSLRMGTNYTCSSTSINLSGNPAPQDCDGGSMIAFIPVGSSSGYRVAYKLDSSTNTIQRCDSINSCVSVVSPEITIDKLKFYVKGATNPSDNIQPSVYMIIRGSVTIKNKITSFAIQTMISERTLE